MLRLDHTAFKFAGGGSNRERRTRPNFQGHRLFRTFAKGFAPGRYVDSHKRDVFQNSYYHTVPGLDVEHMLGQTMREALGDEIYRAIEEQVKAVLMGNHVVFERAVQIGASKRYLKYDYTPDVDATGEVIGFYTMAIDITEAKEVEARLGELARVDKLTGLPNRHHLYERLGEALARSRRVGNPTACLYLDIDHFKSINDILGHAGGDQVLVQFGNRLRACVRETDLVARLAGDEFVIILEGMGQPQATEAVAAKIIASMRAPFEVEGTARIVSTSIGVAISGGADDVDAVLKRPIRRFIRRNDRAAEVSPPLRQAEREIRGTSHLSARIFRK